MTRALRPSEIAARQARVWRESGAYRSDAFAADAGHSWDRVACIAGEYSRREITWRQARAYLGDTIKDVEANHATLDG